MITACAHIRKAERTRPGKRGFPAETPRHGEKRGDGRWLQIHPLSPPPNPIQISFPIPLRLSAPPREKCLQSERLPTAPGVGAKTGFPAERPGRKGEKVNEVFGAACGSIPSFHRPIRYKSPFRFFSASPRLRGKNVFNRTIGYRAPDVARKQDFPLRRRGAEKRMTNEPQGVVSRHCLSSAPFGSPVNFSPLRLSAPPREKSLPPTVPPTLCSSETPTDQPIPPA